MDNPSLRERKMRQRCQPLQDTSGNIGILRSDRSKPFLQGDWEHTHEQSNTHLNRVHSYNLIPAHDSIIQSARAYLTNGTPDILQTISRVFHGGQHQKYKSRKVSELCKITGLPLWSPRAEILFEIFILIIPPYGKRQIKCLLMDGTEPKMGRNKLLSHLLHQHNSPTRYERKNLSSHIQVVAKKLRKDGNEGARKLLSVDKALERMTKIKEMWFDEATMTLREGKLSRNLIGVPSMSNFSRLLPNIDSIYQPKGQLRRVVQSVEFLMGMYQKCVPHQLFHTCTALQSSGGAPAKPIEEIRPFMNLYPRLKDVLDKDDRCELVWFDTSFDVVEQMPTVPLNFAIDFEVILMPDENYTDWKVTTSICHHAGQPLQEFCRDLQVEAGEGGRVTLKDISLLSQWWVRLLSTVVETRQQAGMRYRAQLEALQHGNCVCEECVRLQGEDNRATIAEDDRWHKYFRELSIMQSIHGMARSSGEHHRVAVFLFKFRRTAVNETALTTWHRLVKSESPVQNIDHAFHTAEGSKFGSALKNESASWQPQYPSTIRQELGMNSHNAGDWIYPTTTIGANEIPAYSPQNITPTDSVCSTYSNASLSNNSQGSSSTSTIDRGRDEAAAVLSYQDLNHWPKQRVDFFDNTYCISQQTIERVSTTSQITLHYEGANLSQLPMEDFSFGALHETESLVVEKPFNFNDPPVVPSQNQISQHITDDQFGAGYGSAMFVPQMCAPQPRRIIPTARLSSPIELEGESQEELNAYEQVGISLSEHESHKRRVELRTDGQSSEGQVYQSHSQDHNLRPGYERDAELERPTAEHFLSIGSQNQSSSFHDDYPELEASRLQQGYLESQHSGSIHTSRWQQLPLLSSTYENTTHQISQSSRQISDLSSPGNLQEIQHQRTFEPHPVPLPSQQIATPSHTPYTDPLEALECQSTDVVLLPNWNTNAALEAHNWVLDIAIARTQDMIEQAHAAELGIAELSNTPAACSFYTNPTAGELTPQDGEDCLLINEVQQPMGRILGEIEATPENELVEEGFTSTQDPESYDFQLPDHNNVSGDDQTNLSANATRPYDISIHQNDHGEGYRGRPNDRHRDEPIESSSTPDPQTNRPEFPDSSAYEHHNHEQYIELSSRLQHTNESPEHTKEALDHHDLDNEPDSTTNQPVNSSSPPQQPRTAALALESHTISSPAINSIRSLCGQPYTLPSTNHHHHHHHHYHRNSDYPHPQMHNQDDMSIPLSPEIEMKDYPIVLSVARDQECVDQGFIRVEDDGHDGNITTFDGVQGEEMHLDFVEGCRGAEEEEEEAYRRGG